MARVTSCVVVLLGLCALSLAADAPSTQPSTKPARILANDFKSQDWSQSQNGSELIWLAPAGRTCSLAFDEEAMTPGHLIVETDAKEMVFAGSSHRLTIPLKKGARIDFDQVDGRPVLRLDGDESPAFKGPWIGIMGDALKAVDVSLPGATYASFRWMPGPPSDTRTGATAGARLKAGVVSRPGGLANLSESVPLVAVNDSNGQMFKGGTGFVVSSEGLVVTNFHVVVGGSSADAVFGNEKLGLDLLAIYPELDLAVLRLPPTREYAPLTLRDTSPELGSDVWALGYPESLGFSITKGAVNGIRRKSELRDPRYQSALEHFDADATFIQTDCAINHGNSGGPLVNSAGEVVAVNTLTFAPLQLSDVYLSVAIGHVADVLRRLPETPLGYSGLNSAKATTDYRYTNFGNVPFIDIPSNTDPDDVASAARQLADGMYRDCSRCNGQGFTRVKVRVGTENVGGLSKPIMETRREDCPKCGRSGKTRLHDEAIGRLADSFIRKVASIDRDGRNLQDALRKTHLSVVKTMIGDQATWMYLNQRSRSIIAQEKIAGGTPVVLKVSYVQMAPGTSKRKGDERRYFAVVDKSEHIVLVTVPASADPPAPGGQALVGGLVAGTMELGEAAEYRRVVVVQNGFIITPAIEPGWTWWRN